MSQELKQLFESAGVPAELGEQASAIFAAAVSESAEQQLAEQSQALQEAFEAKFEETKNAWIEERAAELNGILDKALGEWATDNAVAIDATVKVQVAEGFIAAIGEALVNEGFALKNEGESLSEKFHQDSAANLALAESLQQQLTEAQTELNKFKKAEVLTAVTEGMSAVSADRVRSLCEKLTFGNLESFQSQAQSIAEAFGKKDDAKPEDKKEEGGDKGEDKGVDPADSGEKKDGDDKGEGEEEKDKGTNESFDPAAAAAAFLRNGRLLK